MSRGRAGGPVAAGVSGGTPSSRLALGRELLVDFVEPALVGVEDLLGQPGVEQQVLLAVGHRARVLTHSSSAATPASVSR